MGRTINEDVADNVGSMAAYRAYQTFISHHMPEKLLPELNYTPQQLFWFSMASTHCEFMNNPIFQFNILNGSHSPGAYRVRNMVKNVAEFGDDFNCPMPSPMNPFVKCTIW